MNNLFLVESIVSMRKKFSNTEYLVKWQGYSHEENTWEQEQNLIQNCKDLIQAYQKKIFFNQYQSLLLDTQLTMVGDINTDRPFYIIRQNDTQYLISFYPKKNLYVQSQWVKKKKVPTHLIEEFECKKEEKIEEQIFSNEKIGCVIEYHTYQSLVVLLDSKEKRLIENQMIIKQQPLLLIDYFENIKWVNK